MYDTKEKCRELAAKFKQLCAERGTTPYNDCKAFGTVHPLRIAVFLHRQDKSQNRYHDDSLQSAGNLDHRYLR